MKPPTHLQKAGKAFWTTLVDEYGISDGAGLSYATIACECLDRMRAAQGLIKKHGECFEDRYGGLKANPATKVELDSRNGFLSAMRCLNLDIEPPRDKPGRPTGTFGRNQKEH